MPRLVTMAALAAFLAGSTLAAPQASAHGWRRHHHHAGSYHHHRRGWHHDRRHHWASAPLFGWGGCHVRRFVTYYGALAYRQVCH